MRAAQGLALAIALALAACKRGDDDREKPAPEAKRRRGAALGLAALDATLPGDWTAVEGDGGVRAITSARFPNATFRVFPPVTGQPAAVELIEARIAADHQGRTLAGRKPGDPEPVGEVVLQGLQVLSEGGDPPQLATLYFTITAGESVQLVSLAATDERSFQAAFDALTLAIRRAAT